MLVETKAHVGVFAIALGAYLPQFPTRARILSSSMLPSKDHPGHRRSHRRRHRHHQKRAVHGGG